MLARIKKKWKKFLDTIAEQNKATYGEGGINCCELKDVTKTKEPTHKIIFVIENDSVKIGPFYEVRITR